MVSDRSNGIYRGIVVALIGVILIGAAPKDGGKEARKNTHTKTEIGKSAPTIAATSTDPVQIVQRPIMERPCNEGRDNRESDLCAQWKAADAASKAAWWAAIATFVTAIGTFGLFWQIKLTREAVQDTGEATKAMRDANEIARQSNERQLRAYLSATPIHTFLTYLGEREGGTLASFKIDVETCNHGLTPAYDVKVWANFSLVEQPIMPSVTDRYTENLSLSSYVQPNQTININFSVEMLFPLEKLIGNSPTLLLVTGITRYKDVYGIDRHTRFTGHIGGLYDYFMTAKNGHPPLDVMFIREIFGNEAT
jgi:hypothetical protein